MGSRISLTVFPSRMNIMRSVRAATRALTLGPPLSDSPFRPILLCHKPPAEFFLCRGGDRDYSLNIPPEVIILSQQHSVVKSLILHLLPGALITIFFALLAPVLLQAGYPQLFAFYLSILAVLVPFELGYLLYEGRRLNGKWSLRGVVLNRERVPLWQYFVFVPPVLCWAIFFFTVVSTPIDNFLISKLFRWLPSWFFTSQPDLGRYSSGALQATFWMGMAMNGIIGPVTEELYFRGYLMPRISRFRWGAPLLNVVLFSLYHFFTPWQNPGRILAFAPLAFVAWRKRNIYIGMWAHCLLNIGGMLYLIFVPLM